MERVEIRVMGWGTGSKQAYIYRPQQAVELINTFDSTLSGENVLEGFMLDLKGLAEGV